MRLIKHPSDFICFYINMISNSGTLGEWLDDNSFQKKRVFTESLLKKKLETEKRDSYSTQSVTPIRQ